MSDDPTRQATNRRRGRSALYRRLRIAQRQVKAVFAEIPAQRTTVPIHINQMGSESAWVYDPSAQEQIAMEAAILATLNQQLLESQNPVAPPPGWYWEDNVEVPARQGALQALVVFNAYIAAQIAAGVPSTRIRRAIASLELLNSADYLRQLDLLYVREYGLIRSLSQETARQVIRVIDQGMSAGLSPTQISAQITGRFDVARSSAQRIANTEINKAYTNGKMHATKQLADEAGLVPAVRHISALLPTTRESHAARHEKIYTVDQQERWWDQGVNRINCHCSVVSTFLDESGEVAA